MQRYIVTTTPLPRAMPLQTTAGVNSISWVNGGVYFGPAFGLAASGVATTIATAAFLHFA